MEQQLVDYPEASHVPTEKSLPPTSKAPRMLARLQEWGRAYGHYVLLALILAVALYLRTYHVMWDEGQLAHPDELSTVAFYAPSIHWPQHLGDILKPHASSLNPLWDVHANRRRSYTYGHFPLYLLVLTAHAVKHLADVANMLGASPNTVHYLRTATSAPGFAFVGRLLMALSDTLTVLLVYLIARRLYGKGWGLLAATLTTFTVTHIQLAHFFAVDPMSTTFTMLAVYGGMRMAEEGRPRDAALTGIGIAFAVGSKFSALPIVAVPFIAVGLKYWIAGKERTPSESTSPFHLLAISLITATVLFVLTSPYVLLDWPNFKRAVLVEQGAMVRGDADFPFTRQYRGTRPYLYHIEQSVRWGMGWALGIVGWLGLAWAFVRALRRRLRPGEWMLLAWVVLYFGPTGLFLAKFMRYTLPIVPALIIFGVGLLKSLTFFPFGGEQGRRLGRMLGYGLTFIVLAYTIFWALAFVHGVYGYTHPWITASRWIYAHVPDGTGLAVEHWDRQLPLPLPEPNAHPSRYRYIIMPMYDEDTPEKFQIIKNNLREADYYVFASARLYKSIPRLPQRYPMTTRFYQLFFAERLGFVRVLDVHNYPRLGPFVFPDDTADESFWVYDHPRVLIYKKVRDLSDKEWEHLLGDTWKGAKHWDVGGPTLLQRIFKLLPFGKNKQTLTPLPSPAQETQKEPSLLLDMDFDEMPVVRWWRWNRWASEHAIPAIILWWLAVTIIGLMAWPMTFLAFPHLRDRGYAFARGIGLLTIAYLSWLVPSWRWWINDLPLILLTFVLVLSFNAWLAQRYRTKLQGFWRTHARQILFYEGLFTIAYLVFVFIRMLNPDLWQPWNGGAKFMEIAYLNATTRTPYFPPYDPYFAGGTINYYYWGYQIVNVLIKFTGITPTVAFNLAVPTLFALTVLAACGLAYNMVGWLDKKRAMEVGLLGAVFVALLGNLDGLGVILRNLAQISGSDFHSYFPWLQTWVRAFVGLSKVLAHETVMPKYDYWAPSRVIPFTINEFPYWSFLFADLHPHMMGIPFTIIVLGMAFNLIVGARRFWFTEGLIPGLIQYFVLPLTLGALAVINTWDLPTYLGLLSVAFFLRQWRVRSRVNWLLWVFQTGSVALLAYVLFRPFFTHYVPTAASGVGWAPQKTALGKWLNIWGFWYFLAVTFLAVEVTRNDRLPVARWLRGVVIYYDRLPRFLHLQSVLAAPRRVIPTLHHRVSTWICRGGWLILGMSVVLWLLGYRVPAVLLLPLYIAGLLTLRVQVPAGIAFATLLVFTAFLVLFGVEFVYLKDHLQGGDFKRMNTLFKFYIQAWVMLGLAGAVGLIRIWQSMPRWKPIIRAAWQGVFTVLLLASFTFIVVGTVARVKDRFPADLSERPPFGTLDGMAYMKYGVYTWPDPQHKIVLRWDYEAIRWLLDHEPRVVPIAEARLDYYREGGTRVASFTGLPTFMGLHQMGEQRYSWQTGPRQNMALEFWTVEDISRTLEIIRQVDIHYIYVGQLERQQYPPQVLAKFDRMVEKGWLNVVYRNDGVTIYKVREEHLGQEDGPEAGITPPPP